MRCVNNFLKRNTQTIQKPTLLLWEKKKPIITYVVFCISPRGSVEYICPNTKFITAAPHGQLQKYGRKQINENLIARKKKRHPSVNEAKFIGKRPKMHFSSIQYLKHKVLDSGIVQVSCHHSSQQANIPCHLGSYPWVTCIASKMSEL